VLKQSILAAAIFIALSGTPALAGALNVFGFELGWRQDHVLANISKKGLEVIERKNLKSEKLNLVSTSGNGFDGYGIYRVDFIFDEKTEKLEHIIVRQEANTFDDTSKILDTKYGRNGTVIKGKEYSIGPYSILLSMDFDPQYEKNCAYISYSSSSFLRKMAELPSTENTGY
jgi:hypothetical protein